MHVFRGVAQVGAAAGLDLGYSDWIVVDQRVIDDFARATGDQQWIHVDTEAAKGGPFGQTIAHGYLTLSLLPVFFQQLFQVENIGMVINYGLGKVRFPAPVLSGSRVRAKSRVISTTEVPGGVQAVLGSVIEIEGQDRPACVAETIARFLDTPAADETQNGVSQ